MWRPYLFFVITTVLLAACSSKEGMEQSVPPVSLADFAEPFPHGGVTRDWSWQGEGSFPPRVTLHMASSLGLLNVTGPSMPDGVWQEMRDPDRAVGVLHAVGGRFFLIFVGQPKLVAEIAVTSGNRLSFWWDDPISSEVSAQGINGALSQRPAKTAPPSLELLLEPAPPEHQVITEPQIIAHY